MVKECQQIRKEQLNGSELPTGEAVITKGYKLPAQYVIHTVGPIWGVNPKEQDKLLANCYQNALLLAVKKGIKSISFSSISTGVYRFPIKEASAIALQTIAGFLQKNHFGQVTMVLFSQKDYEQYNQTLEEIM